MDGESYRKKLVAFNSTDKYDKEASFMRYLVSAIGSEKVLDYGCGIGVMVNDYLDIGIDAYGYDPEKLIVDQNESRFRDNFHFAFDKIYLMHSIAHIPNIYNILDGIKKNFLKSGGEISVITPNKAWMDTFDNPDYIPDPTVVQHYTSESLKEVFEMVGFDVVMQGQSGDINKGEHERLFIKVR